MRRVLLIAVAVLVAVGAVWASARADLSPRATEADRAPGEGQASGRGRERQGDQAPRRAQRPRSRRGRASRLPVARCPAGAIGCRRASGRVVFVESVDPDGDGDLHVVLAGRAGVSAPGLTAVDVRAGLRPRRDPRVGDRVSAAGLVQPGSHGQAQLHALAFHLRR